MCAEVDLVVSHHLPLHIVALRCELLVIVRLMEIHRVVKARLNELPHLLILCLCEPVDLSCLRCSHPLEPTDRHWLTNCPPLEVVRIELDDLRGGATSVECRHVWVVGKRMPTRDNRHPTTDPDVNHRKPFRIRDEVKSALGVSEHGVTAQLWRAQVVRWIAAVIAHAHTTELLEDVGQEEHVCIEVELQVLLQRGAVEGLTHIDCSGIGSLPARLIVEVPEERSSGCQGRRIPLLPCV